MKKLIILVSILVLIASGMAFGQLTYQGKVYYGVLSDFDKEPGTGWDIRSIFTAKIDDFNTAQMRIRLRNFGLSSTLNDASGNSWASSWLLSSDAPFIDRAWVSTDITGALGMKDGPVSATLYSGFWWDYLDDLSDGVTPFEVADLTQMDLGTGGKQACFNLNMKIVKMVDIRATVAPNNFAGGPTDVIGIPINTSSSGSVLPATKTSTRGGWKLVGGMDLPVGPGKLYPQFTFGAPYGVKAGEGTIVAAAKYTQTAGDIGLTLVPQFRYNLDADVNGGNISMGGVDDKTATYYNQGASVPYFNGDGDLIRYYYALAGAVTYQKLATVKVGFLGYDGSPANRMEANFLVTPVPQLGVEVGTVLNLDQAEYETAEGKSALQCIDLGAFIMAGKTRIKVGYIALGKKNYYDPVNQDLSEVGRGASHGEKGGMYFETLVSF